MANPSSLTGNPAVLEATTTGQSVDLQPGRIYTLVHNGYTTGGSASTSPIFCSFDSEPAADLAAEEHKFPLFTNRSIRIGPGVSTLYFKTAIGAPTFTVMPRVEHMHESG